ncbi:MAG: MarR family transcriptional regulator [Nitrososphaerota archaeon]|nr:MarR family transcriptional regulator [Nitrososphaerota archaeon]
MQKARRMTGEREKGILEYSAWRSLADTYKAVYAHVISDLRQYGLTPPQYAVLRILGNSEAKSLPMSEIGKRMFVTFANITTIVDNLEKRGLVNRKKDPTDRRLVKVELSSSGSSLFKRIYRSHRSQVAKLMEVLDESELSNLISYTDRIKKSTAAGKKI